MRLDDILGILAALEREGVRYAVFGALAMAAHGLDRATRDLDLFVAADEDNVARLRTALTSVFHDPAIAEITSQDLAGAYPAIQYGPPEVDYTIDIVSRLGDAFTFEDLEVGFRFRTHRRTISEADCAAFINLTWLTEELFAVADDSARAIKGRPVPGALVYAFAEGLLLPCALGRAGLTRRKREGDGATPLAGMRALAALWRGDRWPRPRTALDLSPIAPADGWCDAPGDANYNRPVKLPYAASHERMLRDDRLYDHVVVLDWNFTRRVRGAGSAIFLHVAKPGLAPTEGCIAVEPRAMRAILPLLSTRTVLRVLR
jgi:L,D-peptidoglycan transpeptidase YkuD (ErfK/YbiS/YcfS/YnhG family)